MVQDTIPGAPPEWPGYAVPTARLRMFVRHDPRPEKPTLVLLHGLAVHGGMSLTRNGMIGAGSSRIVFARWRGWRRSFG